MSVSLRFRIGAMLVVLLLLTPAVFASGFAVSEQGAKASGQAAAFTARADDASALWYNPAAIAKMDGSALSVGFSLVFLGDTTFDSQMDNISPLFRGGRFDMEDNTATPAHAYYVYKVKDSPWAFGIGITSPFGLVTEWSKTFDGRFSARKSDLAVIVTNLNAAVNVGSGWSLAMGIDYFDASLDEFSRNISLADFDEFTEPFGNLSGDGNDISWNLAAHFRNDDWAFGASYRDGADIDIDGQFAMSNVPSGTIPVPVGHPLFGVPWASQLKTTPASGVLSLPGIWQVGFAWVGSEKWQWELDVQEIMWSDFKELPVDLKNNTAFMLDMVVREDWKDTTTIRLGGSYSFGEQHQLRFGIYTDETAIPDNRLRPSIPDSDRTGYTLGYGFTSASKKFALDAYWLHIEADTSSSGPQDFGGGEAGIGAMLEQGVLWGSYDSSIDLVGVTANWKFGG